MLSGVLKRRPKKKEKKKKKRYNAKFVSDFLRNYFLAFLSRAINCQFSIAFVFLRPDLAIELNEARHGGRYPQDKPPRLLCLDQSILIYNSEDEDGGEEMTKALSAEISDRSDLSYEFHQIKTRPMAFS